jgi:transcriptional regulator with XRE-family HTH domain
MRESVRFGDWMIRDIGRELRVARLTSGRTQREVGAALGTAASHVSRVEHGLLVRFGIRDLCRHAAVVGLKPWIKLFPAYSQPMDRPQLALFTRFRERIGTRWQVIVEVPVPIAGDLRAADALLIGPTVRIMVEVITRLADFQAQLRNARRKQRDIGAERLILVVAGTTTNRRTIRDVGAAAIDAFPVGTRAALQALAEGTDPGADALVLL